MTIRPKSSDELRRLLRECAAISSPRRCSAWPSTCCIWPAPLYMLQVYDRVISSASEVTLVMLTIALLVALLALAGLDAVRARVLTRASIRLDRLIAGRVMTAIIDRASASGGARSQLLRDFDTFRQFITGRGDPRRLRSALGADLHPGDFRSCIRFSARLRFGSAVLLILMALLNEMARQPAAYRSQRGRVAQLRLHRNEPAQLGGGAGDGHDGRPAAALGPRPQPHARAAGHRERSRRDHAEHHPVSASLDAVGDPRPRRLSGDRAAGHGRRDVCRQHPARPRAAAGGADRWLLAQSGSARAAPIIAFVICWRLRPPRDPNLDIAASGGASVGRRPDLCAAGNASKPILRGVSFRIEPGEVLGVIGPSGAGKSTLARQIVGVHVALRGCGAARWRRCVDLAEGKRSGVISAILPQDIELFADTVAANISRFQQGEDAEVIDGRADGRRARDDSAPAQGL